MGFKMSALILCFCFAALLLKSVDCADKTTTGATNEVIEFPQKIIIPTTYTVGDIETQFPQTANADVLQPYLCPGNILCFKRKCLVKPGDTPGDSTCPPNSETKVAKTMEKGKCWVDPSKEPKTMEDAFKTSLDTPGGGGLATKKDQGKGSATVWYISKGVGILTILMNLFM